MTREPAGDLAAAGAGEQPGALDVDAGVDEGGGDALGEVLQLVGDLGAGAGGEVEVVDLVDQDEVDAGVDAATPQTASMMSVMLARRMKGRPRNRANSIGEHPRGGRRRDGDVDDRDAAAGPGDGARCDDARAVLPSWVSAVVLPVPAGPETIRPRRALICVLVEQDQQPSAR